MKIQGGVDNAVEQVRLELVTRKLMIMLVGLIGVWVGIAIILTGAPNFVEEWFSPWSRYWVGGLALLSGFCTVFGSVWDDRTRCGWWGQAAGLAGMTIWYLSMGAIYFTLVTTQGFDLVGPGEPLAADVTGRGYVPLLYAGLAMMAATPLVTLVNLRRLDLVGGRQDA